MTDKSKPPLLLFYPTSPVHVRDMQLVMDRLPDWRYTSIVCRLLEKVAPGIGTALEHYHIARIDLDDQSALESMLPKDAAVLVVGAVFEPFALELVAWAKLRQIPVIAIQEVAQLALNQFDINNYDAPFDRLFVASQDEQRRFLTLNYPPEMVCMSGLLAYDRFSKTDSNQTQQVFDSLGITDGKEPIVYTTSPFRSRLALHNKDDRAFREKILTQLAEAGRNTGRIVVIKLHPNENIEINQQIIERIIPNAVVVGRDLSMDEILPITGVLVNRGNSQTCLEAVLRGVPTVVAACGLKTLFHGDGGAYIVESVDSLASTIETALHHGAADITRIRSNHFYLPKEGAATYIAGELEHLVGAQKSAQDGAWNWLIKSMLFVGRHDRALAWCERSSSRSRWQDLACQALRAHVDQRLPETISYWLQCAAFDREWFFPHYELAHGYLVAEEFDLAISHAQKAIELHPPFHSLWHNLPMRIVIMASLRRKGDFAAARRELRVLDEQGLVEIVPELLIEAAAQHYSMTNLFEEAEGYLDKAVEQLHQYPVDRVGDRHILERVLTQYIELAGKRAEAGDTARATACLARLLDVARSDPTLQNHISLQLGKLGERRELAADYLFADKCYAAAMQADPASHWYRYRQSCMALAHGNSYKAFQGLYTLARLPNASKAIIDKLLSPAGAARLTPYWPASPKSIVKPLALPAYMAGWFLTRLANSGLRELHTSITAVFLVWIFVARHFVRRLRAESLKIRKLIYRTRSFLSSAFPSRDKRVTNCPICGARGKFEYQNKQTPLLRCLDCHHVWARDLPDDGTLNALYGDFGYWERDRYHQGITTIQESEQWQVYLNARISILRRLKLLDNTARQTKRVFEIGCAEGMLLHELRKRGMEVMGCEMNRAVAAEGAKTLGVEILIAPFEKIELPTKTFDLVMSFHTLEHLRDPASVLAQIANILRPDGAVLLEVPCGEEEYENTDHLHFFSDTSLRALLRKFFRTTEILDNSYTNSAGVKIGSIYGFGKDL